MLVWYDAFETREAAFVRERQMKEGQRAWKLQVIERSTPSLSDLYETLNQ